MSVPPDNTLADLEQIIADRQRQLAECKAERDEALEQQTATAEVLRVINRRRLARRASRSYGSGGRHRSRAPEGGLFMNASSAVQS